MVVFLVCALAPLVYLVYSLLPVPQGPSLAAKPDQPPDAKRARADGTTTRSGPRGRDTAKTEAQSRPEAQARQDEARTKPRRSRRAPKRAAKPKLSRGRTPSQRRSACSAGAATRARSTTSSTSSAEQKTIFQTRTLQPSAELPARARVRPGTYKVLVRPAVPSDAGIILGAAILQKTMTL